MSFWVTSRVLSTHHHCFSTTNITHISNYPRHFKMYRMCDERLIKRKTKSDHTGCHLFKKKLYKRTRRWSISDSNDITREREKAFEQQDTQYNYLNIYKKVVCNCTSIMDRLWRKKEFYGKEVTTEEDTRIISHKRMVINIQFCVLLMLFGCFESVFQNNDRSLRSHFSSYPWSNSFNFLLHKDFVRGRDKFRGIWFLFETQVPVDVLLFISVALGMSAACFFQTHLTPTFRHEEVLEVPSAVWVETAFSKDYGDLISLGCRGNWVVDCL